MTTQRGDNLRGPSLVVTVDPRGLGCNLAHARALYNPTRYDDLVGRVSPHEGVLLMEEYETQLDDPLRVFNLV